MAFIIEHHGWTSAIFICKKTVTIATLILLTNSREIIDFSVGFLLYATRQYVMHSSMCIMI